MKDFKLYTFTSLLYIVLFGAFSLIIIPLIVKAYTVVFLDTAYNNITNEANMLTIAHQMALSEEEFIKFSQTAITDTEEQLTFLSIINWTGNYVCYPDITRVDENTSKDDSTDFNGDINGSKLFNHFFTYSCTLKKEYDTEIINLLPLKGSDLILAYNLNLKEVNTILDLIKERTYITFLILGLIVLLIILLAMRLLSTYYNKQLDSKLKNLEFSAQSLSSLNESINSYQEKIKLKESSYSEDIEVVESSKERILTYIRNELVSILVSDIAYIYVENTITYIIQKNGKMATSNESLDKIYSSLDKKIFFKTNRQFIVSIFAIEKIIKFENSKLKIEVKPISKIDIIIGKNKTSAFKQWLDM